jgi:hypothetical protein
MLGMNDYQLETLSLRRISENGRSVWATWESERTSFGKTFRRLIRYPSFLPLFFSSDHYVDMLTSYRSNEANPSYRLYFTWNKAKCIILREQHKVNAHHIEHPWMRYRREKYPRHSQTGIGTLIFWPHSHGSLNVKVDFEAVKKEFEKIPIMYHPLSICVSSLDVQNGLHRELRQLGYPLHTIGNVSSQNFVDRFYTTLNQFRFAGGFYPGSHIYYCHEFGVPYIALDYRVVEMQSIGNDGIPDGTFDFLSKDYPDENQKRIFETWYSSLMEYSEFVTEKQMLFARENLGCFATTSLSKIQFLAYRALLFNGIKMPLIYITYIWNIAKRLNDKSGT